MQFDLFGTPLGQTVVALGISLLMIVVCFNLYQVPQVRLALLLAWYRYPAIGKLDRLSRVRDMGSGGYSLGEQQLCSDFAARLFRAMSYPKLYVHARSYLRKVREESRQAVTLLAAFTLLIATIAMVATFGSVFGRYTLPGAQEKLQIQFASGLGLIYAVILAVMVHAAGREQYKRSMIARVREMWLANHMERDLWIGAVFLQDDASDDHAAPCQQFAARLRMKPGGRPELPLWSLNAVLCVAMVTMSLIYVKFQQSRSLLEAIMLALPAVCVAGVAFYIGLNFGFAGSESKVAWKIVHRFPNETAFDAQRMAQEAHVVAVAERCLAHLQEKLAKRGLADRTSSIPLTFRKYIESIGEVSDSMRSPENSRRPL